MTTLQHIAAFCDGRRGGNPAGVVLCEAMPPAHVMQKIAAEVGYSETVFAAPNDEMWRARYFAPELEVDFCGHATVALGAALARLAGPGHFALMLNRARISVEGFSSGTAWGAAFELPPTRSTPVATRVLDEALALFRLSREDLDERIPPAVANGGGDHLVLALRSRNALRDINYDFQAGRALAEREGYITFSLVVAQTAQLFHARNPFPIGGVYEDPATGAAAAALAGYLRDLGWPHEGAIAIHQGEDMGIPCRLEARVTPSCGAPVRVSGQVRSLRDDQPLQIEG